MLENTLGEVIEFLGDQPRFYGRTNNESIAGLVNPVGPERTGEESFADRRCISLDGM